MRGKKKKPVSKGNSAGSKKFALNAEPDTKWLYVNPYLVCGVLGASLTTAVFFSVLLFPGIIASGLGTQQLAFISAAFLLAMAISYIALFAMSDLMQRHRKSLAVFAFVMCVLGPISFFIEEYAWLAYVSVAAVGIGTGCMAALWMEFVATQLKSRTRTAVASYFAIAFVWIMVISIAEKAFAPVVLIVYAAISSGMYLFIIMSFRATSGRLFIKAKESDERCQIGWRSGFLIGVVAIAQGLVLYWLIVASARQGLITIITALLICMLAIGMLFDSMHRIVLRESFIRHLSLPILAACLLAIILVPEDWRFLPCMLAFAFSILPFESSLFATSEHIVRFRLSTIRAYSKARLWPVSGMLLGLLLGWEAFEGGMFGDFTQNICIGFAVLMVVTVFAVFSVMKSYFPGEEGESVNAPIKLSINGDIEDESEAAKSDSESAALLAGKCRTVASKYRLTKRQEEVLNMLAQGRNVAYIQEQLVISPYTAKAHIYNIYKKTNRHSQKSLIKLVSETDAFEMELSEA